MTLGSQLIEKMVFVVLRGSSELQQVPQKTLNCIAFYAYTVPKSRAKGG